MTLTLQLLEIQISWNSLLRGMFGNTCLLTRSFKSKTSEMNYGYLTEVLMNSIGHRVCVFLKNSRCILHLKDTSNGKTLLIL